MKKAFAFLFTALFSTSAIFAQTVKPTDAEFKAAFDEYIRGALAKTSDVPAVAGRRY
jgi:hypothetical protein